MIERWTTEALAASRSTRTSRTPMVAASGSAAVAMSSAWNPAGSNSSRRRPAGIDSLRRTWGSRPQRLTRSQAMSTRVNQRRVARSRRARATICRIRTERHRAMAAHP